MSTPKDPKPVWSPPTRRSFVAMLAAAAAALALKAETKPVRKTVWIGHC